MQRRRGPGYRFGALPLGLLVALALVAACGAASAPTGASPPAGAAGPSSPVVQIMRDLEDLPALPPETQWIDRGPAERARQVAAGRP